MHEDRDIETVEHELRVHGFLKEGVTVDLDALHAYLAPLAEPSRVETFKFTREWLREEASRVTDMRSAAISRRLNMPPSYILIHRVSTAGIGVLCQLECEGQFRAEVIKWMPGYTDPLDPVPDDHPAEDVDAAAAEPDVPTAGPGIPTAGPGIPTAGPGIPTAGPGIPTAGPGIPTAGPGIPTAGPGIPTAGSGIPTEELEVAVENLDVGTAPGRDDPDDARAGVASPNG